MPVEKTRSRKTGERQAALSMRIAPATRDELVERAAASGRSVTQEADRLLQQALVISKIMDSGLKPMIEVLSAFDRAGTQRAEELEIAGDWATDQACYMAALSSGIRRMLELTPDPWDGKLVHTALEQALLQAQRRRTEGSPGGFVAQPEAGKDDAA